MSDIVLSASEVKALRDAVLINASGEAIGLDLPAIKRIITERMAQAWDEGYTSGHSNAMRRMSDEPDAPTTPNRYR